MKDDDVWSTRRMSVDQMAELKQELDKSREHKEIVITVTKEVCERIEKLLPEIMSGASKKDLEFTAAIRRIFMTGLDALETDSRG